MWWGSEGNGIAAYILGGLVAPVSIPDVVGK